MEEKHPDSPEKAPKILTRNFCYFFHKLLVMQAAEWFDESVHSAKYYKNIWVDFSKRWVTTFALRRSDPAYCGFPSQQLINTFTVLLASI